jgi:DNA polymerase I
MGEWDVRLLTASYRREGPEELPVVQLFGRTRDGQSIAVEYPGFEPYYYVVSPTAAHIGQLEKDPGVHRVEEKELLLRGSMVPVARVVLKHPWETPAYRERSRAAGHEILAADIPFAHRFIYDLDIASCTRVSGEPLDTERYTTDLAVEAKAFEAIDPFRPALKVLSFDIENSIKDGHLLTIGCALREDGGMRTAHFEGTEAEIIKSFVNFVRSEDPDVITGYNIDGYDIPTIIERAQAAGSLRLSIGRDGAVPRSYGNRFWRLTGRIIADAWWNVKKQLHPKQETLDAVAKQLFSEGKADVDPRRMDEEWAADKDKVIRYCIRDAELALRILEEIAILEQSMDLAAVSKLPLDEAVNGRTSTMIDSILIREADRNGVAVPMMTYGSRSAPIEGGYVHTIEAGTYDWVAVLDFLSMYPSIIISNNICFTTLSEEGTIETPSGAKYLSRDVREGLVPKILEQLMKERDELKAKMEAAKDEREREYYDGLQYAVKTLMNAFYGVLASSFYRFTDKRIGSSITAVARDNIKRVIQQLEDEGIKVIYGDTDSVFFQSPYENLEETVRFGKEVAERFSRGGAVLEFERVLKSMFSHGRKKRYVGKAVWPKEEFIVRGYEIRRTDAFQLQEEAQMAIFEKVLVHDIDGAVETARDIITSVHNGEVPVEKLVISRTVKEESAYVNPDSMANVQAARKLKSMGYEFVPGMKVSWVVTNAKAAPQEVTPYVSGRKFEATPDWEYYARRVAHTISYVLETFGWNEKSLLTGIQQKSLFDSDSFGGNARNQRMSGPRKTDKKLTLEDFM